ncbi:MAG: phytoene desaturase family protein, partial [Pseudomonadota bacterium]
PGGRAAVFRQDGFTFDAGPTIVTAPFLFDELWALCGRRREDDVELRWLDPFYKLRFDDGSTFTCRADAEAMADEVARLSPDDVAGYKRFMQVSERMYRLGFDPLADKPFDTLWDMARILPLLIRMRADRSVWGLACKHVRDPRLRLALSFHPLFVGGDPLRATAFYSMVSFLERQWGVSFAMGGTGALVTGLVGLIEGAGDRVRCDAPVAEILLAGGASGRPRARGVRLENGEEIAADIVVSNADSGSTYRKLLPPSARKVWSDRAIDRTRFSMSLVVWYFGTNRRYEDVEHHTIVLGPRYEDLLRDIFRRKVLADDFSLYLHRPTKTDPSLAPEGCDAFYVLSPVPNLEADVDWETAAEPYRRRIEQRLSETVLPGLERHVVSSKMITPLDFRDRLSSEQGAAFGVEPILTQMAWFRPHNRSEDVDGLYLVGAGSHPGAGLPGVLCSAKVLDRVTPHASELV